MDFTDKTVLITGATSGIGKTTAEEFAASGANVVISGRRLKQGKSIKESMMKKGLNVLSFNVM